MKGNLLSFCEHPYGGTKYCAKCVKYADVQFRTYVRIGDDRMSSIAYSIYLCWDHATFFRNELHEHVNEEWTVKISTDKKYIMRGKFDVNTPDIRQDTSTEKER